MSEEEKPRLDDDRCTRCMQPIPKGAQRCPNCLTRRSGGRALPLALGVGALAALLVLVLLIVRSMWTGDSHSDRPAPAPTNQSNGLSN